MEQKDTRILLTLLFVGVLMGAVDIAIIGPALPAIQAEFFMDNRQLAVLFNSYVLCQMVGTQLLAKLADRIGPRVIYTLSVSCFGAGSLILAVAGNVTELYVGRAVQGFGAGGIFPVAAAVIAARLPPQQRGPALGLLGSVWGLAFFIGPVLGGIFLRFSWHWLFLVNLPIAAVLIAGAWRLLPTATGAARQPFDTAGAVTLVLAVSALVIGINQIDTSDLPASLFRADVAPLLITAAALVPMFWFFEKRAADPVLRPGLLGSRQVVTSCVIAAGAGAMQTASVFFPAVAVAAIGVSQSNAAFMLLPGVVASTLASLAFGNLINAVGTRLLVMTSLVLAVISFLIYGHARLDVATFLVANVISGIGSAGLIGAPLRWTLLNESQPQERGAAQGLLSNVTSVGRLLGAATVGAVATSAGGGVTGYQSAFIGMAILAGTLLLLAATLKSRAAEQSAAADVAAASA